MLAVLATLGALTILTIAALCALAYPLALALHWAIVSHREKEEAKRLRAAQEKRLRERRAAQWAAF